MKSASDLSDEQKQTLLRWAEEGASLQEIQRRLDEELGLRFTFMETRFLAGDLNLPIKSPPKPEPETPSEPDAGEPEPVGESPEAGPIDEGEAPPDGSGAPAPAPQITVDQITKPGMLISGKVTFSGGKGAAWSLDQFGRLALDPDDLDFRPSQEEIMAFQQELQRVAGQQGI